MTALALVLGLLLFGAIDARSTKNGNRRFRRGVMQKLDDEIHTELIGTLKSPNYPNNYPKDTEKSYIIKFPDEKAYYKVTFSVKDMDIETHSSCSYDYLLINAGGIGKLCGKKTNQVYTVDEAQVSVTAKFLSDYVVVSKGFEINYTVEKLSDGCTNMPCNNGTCTAIGRSDFNCSCYPGYAGQHCDSMAGTCLTDSDCSMHGQCYDYDCMCMDGYSGTHCDIAPDCVNDADCSGHGYCNNYTCSCDMGYMGVTCNRVCDFDSDCGNYGTCVNNHCNCTRGYFGDKCENVHDCTMDYECGNYGQCADNHCFCNDGYEGTYCEIAPSNTYFNNSSGSNNTSSNYSSVCTGNSDCGMHGVCVGLMCACYDGYTGVKCQIGPNNNSGSDDMSSVDIQKVYDLLQLAKSKSTASKNKMKHVQEVLAQTEKLTELKK